MKRIFFLAACCSLFTAGAQYAPQAGIPGSTAIPASSSQIVSWAASCNLHRGYLDIAQPGLGLTTTGSDIHATGAADNLIVSLGDSGVAVLTFAVPIINGPGADFAVFENGFLDPSDGEEAFLELAFVEVSSDGQHYFRFPASSNTQAVTQIPGSGVYMNARALNNLAGKYISNYGTPFDLEDLSGTPGLNVHHITHVRIVDVIGALSESASADKDGNRINDPYPTAFPTGGFDLDAVGVINQLIPAGTHAVAAGKMTMGPNPAIDKVTISLDSRAVLQLNVTDVTGKVSYSELITPGTEIWLGQYKAGIYFFNFTDEQGNKWVERVVKL